MGVELSTGARGARAPASGVPMMVLLMLLPGAAGADAGS